LTRGLKLALGQFAVQPDWSDNLTLSVDLAHRAASGGADLLVLPEGILSRVDGRTTDLQKTAQPLDGPFVTGLRSALDGIDITVVAGIHEHTGAERVTNTLVVLHGGELVTVYRKLHLYDAFGSLESSDVEPGEDGVSVFMCRGVQVGLMTCYDIRFPEMARLLVDRGAELLVLPAAWVRGPLKEHHWDVMVTARALENTCYVAATGECGKGNIGHSMVVDPLGVAIARTGSNPALVLADIDLDEVQSARRLLPVLSNRRFQIDPTVLPLPAPTDDLIPAQSA
jgi:deaminated glutathione amidase